MVLYQEDGECWTLPAAIFFRSEEDLPPAELVALQLCAGRVLDVGAGAGCHSLILQDRDFDVIALDVDPRAIEVMRRRGVHSACRGDVRNWNFDRLFDTVLLLMNGIGLVGDLDGLDRFLRRAATLVAPGGQLLFDSADLRRSDNPRELGRMTARVREGRYRGATWQRLTYQGVEAPPLAWLYVDDETLAEHAGRAGWNSQVVFSGDDGSYLARLRRR